MLTGGKYAAILDPGPVPRGGDWLNWVNQPQSEAELAALRKCIERGTPYGSETWQHATAERLGLEASLRPRGRPRSVKEKLKCAFFCRSPRPATPILRHQREPDL